MKTNLVKIALLAVLSAHLTARAQTVSEPVIVSVDYEFKHVTDTNNKSNPSIEQMTLELGQNSSKYHVAYTPAILEMKKRQKENAGTPTIAPGTVTAVGVPVAVLKSPEITDIEMFQHVSNHELNICASVGMQNYIIPLKLPVIDWKISTETREIGGYKCQKATGQYAGRLYTAWFAPELPFKNGPWKLSGLPGAILEAHDANNEVSFTFKAITKDNGENTASDRKRLITASEEAFNKAKKAFEENPVATMQAQLPAGSPTVRLAYKTPNGKFVMGEEASAAFENSKKEYKSRFNNPLERTKK